MTRYRCEYAWLGGDSMAADVVLDIDDGVVVAVGTGGSGGTALPGVTIPGLVDMHSHAFHRALRGRTQDRRGDFWTWRGEMYAIAERLDPDSYADVAAAAFAESVLAGTTTVFEFHYVHHGPGGVAYDDPNAMGHAITAAAGRAGVRLTLLDTCYLRAGFAAEALDPVQQRFSDGTVDEWAARSVAGPAGGAAIHSVRAVAPTDLSTVAAAAADRGWPLHVHVSEQRAENEACEAATGRTPARLLHDAGVLGPRTTAVHATHVSPDDVALIAGSGTAVCLCPTTERDLADGLAPVTDFAAAGVALSAGSDSRAVVDGFEEARAIELDERLRTGRRGGMAPATLLGIATQSSGITAGQPADLVTIGLASPRLAGFDAAHGAGHLAFAATAGDVTRVMVAGDVVVEGGEHASFGDVGAALDAALRALV